MNLDEILKQFDPAQEAGGADVAGMRETILTSKRPSPIMRRAVIACALLVALTAVIVSRRREHPRPPVPIVRKAPIHQPASRQLQITTPGGTRLIWVFGDGFSM